MCSSVSKRCFVKGGGVQARVTKLITWMEALRSSPTDAYVVQEMALVSYMPLDRRAGFNYYRARVLFLTVRIAFDLNKVLSAFAGIFCGRTTA